MALDAELCAPFPLFTCDESQGIHYSGLEGVDVRPWFLQCATTCSPTPLEAWNQFLCYPQYWDGQQVYLSSPHMHVHTNTHRYVCVNFG